MASRRTLAAVLLTLCSVAHAENEGEREAQDAGVEEVKFEGASAARDNRSRGRPSLTSAVDSGELWNCSSSALTWNHNLCSNPRNPLRLGHAPRRHLPVVCPLSRSPCELLTVDGAHPVQALLKSYAVQSGCSSRGTIALPQEVHIINLRHSAGQKPAEDSDCGTLRAVFHVSSTEQGSQLAYLKISTLSPAVLVLHTSESLDISQALAVTSLFPEQCGMLGIVRPFLEVHFPGLGARRYLALWNVSRNTAFWLHPCPCKCRNWPSSAESLPLRQPSPPRLSRAGPDTEGFCFPGKRFHGKQFLFCRPLLVFVSVTLDAFFPLSELWIRSVQFHVVLHLRPIQSLSVHRKPLVFILNSPVPVLWRLQTEKLAPGVKRVFLVSEGSNVQLEARNRSRSSEVRKETLPHSNENLLSWAKLQYHAVTSFSELAMAHDVYIKVGEDPELSDTCKIDNKFLSLNYLASYVQPQPSMGCVLSGPESLQEVHIIELQAPNSSSAFQVDVIVDLRPLEVAGPLLRDVVLLLRCEKSVNWVIRVHDIHGRLHIVTSDSVSLSASTERLMQVTKTVRQRLPTGAQALMQWAEEKAYTPVRSYTRTAMANIFNLRLREADVVDPLTKMFPPELSILRDTNPLHPHGTQDPPGRPSLPFFFPPGRERPFLPLAPSVQEQAPEEHRGALSVGLTLRCEENRMVVTLDKESLQASGIGKANITLQDPQCKATSNITHYVLETPLTGCQTAKYSPQSSPVVLYMNSIMISQSETKDGSGWPSDDEDLESGDVLFPGEPHTTERTALDTAQRSILFNCTYSVGQDPPAGGFSRAGGAGRPQDSGDNVTFSMELFNTKLFRYPVPQSIATVLENKPIFVEISATKTDPDLGFVIQTCFVSPNSNPMVPSDYIIFENVCPTDDTVLYYPQKVDFPIPHAQMDRQRFSFTFRSRFNVSVLFLHCEMSLCSNGRDDPQGLPQCMMPKVACASVSADLIMKMAMNTKVSTKPLVVVSDEVKTGDREEEASTQMPASPPGSGLLAAGSCARAKRRRVSASRPHVTERGRGESEPWTPNAGGNRPGIITKPHADTARKQGVAPSVPPTCSHPLPPSDDTVPAHRPPLAPSNMTPPVYVLDTPTVVGIAFAAFVIGALLTGALWLIYSHTGGATFDRNTANQPTLVMLANISGADSEQINTLSGAHLVHLRTQHMTLLHDGCLVCVVICSPLCQSATPVRSSEKGTCTAEHDYRTPPARTPSSVSHAHAHAHALGTNSVSKSSECYEVVSHILNCKSFLRPCALQERRRARKGTCLSSLSRRGDVEMYLFLSHLLLPEEQQKNTCHLAREKLAWTAPSKIHLHVERQRDGEGREGGEGGGRDVCVCVCTCVSVVCMGALYLVREDSRQMHPDGGGGGTDMTERLVQRGEGPPPTTPYPDPSSTSSRNRHWVNSAQLPAGVTAAATLKMSGGEKTEVTAAFQSRSPVSARRFVTCRLHLFTEPSVPKLPSVALLRYLIR
ncbi:hypothetical protein P4O66_009821 [Electrophorus voltai]|uniref:ZP domain-containing protein n=1 Tax=Electrophorus voltai TaxID=2609070 RepID=A0AAD9DXQ3_9TELE|nr:hypothetical protein P4O66_009821 [Electrophorus voltai]